MEKVNNLTRPTIAADYLKYLKSTTELSEEEKIDKKMKDFSAYPEILHEFGLVYFADKKYKKCL